MKFGADIASRIRWIGAAKTSASAVVFSLATRFFIVLLNVATGIIVARTLGPAGRGAAAAISLWAYVTAGLMTLGVPAALRYEVRRRIDEPAVLLSTAMIMSAILGALAFIIGFTVVPFVLGHYSRSVVVFAQLMMIFAPAMLCTATLQAYFESCGDFRRSNAMIYIPPVFMLLGLIILVALHRMTPFAVAIMYETPFALLTIVTLVHLRKHLRLPADLSGRVRSMLHYGGRAYGIDIVNTLAGQVDQAMVVGLLSAKSFGLFVVAVSGSRIVSLLGSSLNSVILPKAAGLEPRHAVEVVCRSARLVFACSLLGGLALAAALPIVVPVLYGAAYSSLVGLTQLLAIAVVFGSTAATLSQAFLATGRPEIATMIQIAGVCLTIPLMLILIPRFGLRGAAYATIISNASRFVLVLIAYPLFLKHTVPAVLPTRRDIEEAFARFRRVTA